MVHLDNAVAANRTPFQISFGGQTLAPNSEAVLTVSFDQIAVIGAVPRVLNQQTPGDFRLNPGEIAMFIMIFGNDIQVEWVQNGFPITFH